LLKLPAEFLVRGGACLAFRELRSDLEKGGVVLAGILILALLMAKSPKDFHQAAVIPQPFCNHAEKSGNRHRAPVS
jgi:hypothetical protein